MHNDIEVRDSPIHGKGLFAKKLIPKGTITWIIDLEQVEVYTGEQYHKSSLKKKEEIRKYGLNKGDLTFLMLDDSNYENHSVSPNITNYGSYEISNKDIQPNEELLIDYGSELSLVDCGEYKVD